VWTDPDVHWDAFDLVVANGAWDNIHRPDEFLDWVDRTALLTRVVNSPATLRWNMDKHYLAALAEAGVRTLETIWVSASSPPDAADIALPDGELVIKPTVSGGGFLTGRYSADNREDALAHIDHVRSLGRDLMVQRYEERIDADGEKALIFLDGHFSHAIRKGPLLRPDTGPQSDLWRFEDLRAVEPDQSHLDTAQRALSVAEALLGPTTYARVDLIPLADGTPAVLELELLDPALFFEIQPSGISRYADVLAQRVASGAGR
jgi:glutathione synthase/RimK-type ligase-like ATP-grasp enzyme